MKVTADTITDEQIRELRDHSSETGEGWSMPDGEYWPPQVVLNVCDEALRDFDYGDAFVGLSMAEALRLTEERACWSRARRLTEERACWSRARCAEAWNARHGGES